MNTITSSGPPTLAEELAIADADLKKATDEALEHIEWLRSHSPSRGDDEPERNEQCRVLVARIRNLKNRHADLVRREQRQQAETEQIMAASGTEAERKRRASLPESQRIILDRLDVLERRVNAVVAVLRRAGFRGVE